MKIWKTLSKRGLALFLVLTMCMSLLQVTAFAEEGAENDVGTTRLACELEEHTHSEDCYTVTPESRELTCGQEETEGHAHGDECYTVSETKELTCTDESEGHTHEDTCYTTSESKELTCGQEETEGHAHSDACYTVTPASRELTCGKEEHTHDGTCLAKTEPPVETVCTCTDKCTEDAVNADCPVCGVEGADLTACKGEEAAAEVPEAVQAFLTAVAALESADPEDAEAYTQLGQAAMDAYEAVQTAGLEDYEGVGEALEKLMALADKQTGGTETLEETNAAAVIGEESYDTLAAAIAEAGEGATITLQKNLSENVTSNGKSYTLDMGYYTLSSAEQKANVYTINGGTVTIMNGKITGGDCAGRFASGSGILAYGDAHVTLDNVAVTGNSTGYTENVPKVTGSGAVKVHGGGIGIYGGSLTLNNCEVSNNSAKQQGGGIWALESSVTITGASVITGNSSGTYGSGIHVDNSDLAIDGGSDTVSISGSSTNTYAVIYSLHPKTVSVKNADITVTNEKSSNGNALYAGYSTQETASVSLENVSIRGGGAAFNTTNLAQTKLAFTAKDCTFQGMTLASKNSGIVYLNTAGDALLEGCTFTGSTATVDTTAPICITAKATASNVRIEGCTFSGNTGFAAGAVRSVAPAGTSVAITGGSITGNTTTFAGAIHKAGTGTMTVADTTIKENTSTGKTGGVYIATGGFSMTSGALYGNTAQDTPNDVYSAVATSILPAGEMQDGDFDFTGYQWVQGSTKIPGQLTQSGTWAAEKSVEKPKPNVAQIGDTMYTSFADAMAAANQQASATIKLIAEDQKVLSDGMYTLGASSSSAPQSTLIPTCKNLTIDMNGCTIVPTGVATNSGYNALGYGIFQVNGGYTLTLIGEGTVGNRINVKLNGTLNLNGNVKVDTNYGAAYRATAAQVNNFTGGVRSLGTVNVNSSMDSLRAELYCGTLNIADNVTVETLDVQVRCNQSGEKASAFINGKVGDAAVCQFHSAQTMGTNAVEISGNVTTLELVQKNNGSSSKINTAMVSGKVENFTLRQTSKPNTVYLNGPVTNLSASNHISGNNIPTLEVGPQFKADFLSIMPDALVNVGSVAVQEKYANPGTPVDDVVLITGRDGYEITSEQVGKTEWDTGSYSLSDAFKANKHLTKIMVDEQGRIVLRKLQDDTSHIYLDGTAETDGTGSYLSPFKSFAGAVAAAGENGTIYVLGEVAVNEPLDGNGVTLKRYETYKGALLKASGTASLANITLDGGKEDGFTATEPLVQVTGGTLTIGNGVILQNNVNTYKATGHEGGTGGGALWIGSGAKAVMNGGEIKNNTAVMGGGVQVSVNGSFELTGGTISGNFAGFGTDVTYTVNGTKYGSAGGGVFISSGASMTMNGGTVEDNKAFTGGGIGLSGEIEPNQLVKFTMNDGTVQNNTAVNSGGGIYLNHNCEATIIKGHILSNTAKGLAEGLHYNTVVAGGGIYVNGGKRSDGATKPNGKLILGNQANSKILITGNSAMYGGGIAFCPTGTGDLEFRLGTFLYGNTGTGGRKDDFQFDGNLMPPNGGLFVPTTLQSYISMWMADGTLYNWTDVETGMQVNESQMRNKARVNVYADVTPSVNADECDIVIQGNISNKRGGGIGNNGDLVLGSLQTYDITVNGAKLWVDEHSITITGDALDQIKANVPTITFRLWARHVSEEPASSARMLSLSAGTGEDWILIDEREGYAENDWRVTFNHLLARDAGGKLEYKIEELPDTSYGKYAIVKGEAIVSDFSEPVEIVNQVDYGLRLTKKVDDPYGVAKEGAEYPFTIILTDADSNPVTGTFDDIEFQKGEAKVTLKNGESVTITGLGSEWKYTVTEKTPDGFKTPHFTTKQPYMRDLGSGYSIPDMETTYASGETVSANLVLGRTEVTCTNTTEQPRNSLTISKTVEGSTGDKKNPWTFSLKLTGEDGKALKAPAGQQEYVFDYSVAGMTVGTMKVDAEANAVFTKTGVAIGSTTFTLKHGEFLTISGLPAGTKYAVTEAEANEDNYTTTATINGEAAALAGKAVSGTISKDSGSLVAFTNTRVSYTVVHEYYTNGSKDGETRGDPVTGKIGYIVNASDIVKVLTYNGVGGYTFTSATPDSITLDEVETKNVITLRYDRTIATTGRYTVIHQYYTNGTLDGSTTSTPSAGIGEVIRADSITRVPSYAGNTYTFTDITGGGFTIVANGNSGTITLRYDRTVATEGSYRVVHEYYTNGALTGSNSATVTAPIGAVINEADITRVPNYGGETYTFTSITGGGFTIVTNGINGTITLRYDRTVVTPGPGPGPVTPVTPVTPNPGTPTIPDTPTPIGPSPTTPGTDIADPDVPLGLVGLNTVDHIAYIIGYEDGLVRPEGKITRAEVATIFFRLMTDEFRTSNWATQNAFPDVAAANWFNNAVSTNGKAGIVKGYMDGEFKPNRNITRAEFAAIAARFLSEEDAGPGGRFSDISGHWAEEEINRAVAAGWIRGYEDGTFRPDQDITRAEAVTLINRMLDRMPDKDHLLENMITWPDNTEDKWYYEDMQEATNSHDYDRDEAGIMEVWTEKLEERKWKELEYEWSTAASAPGREVADNLQNGSEPEGEAETAPETTGDGEE